MEITSETLTTLAIFLAFVWPGLLAVNVYRLVIPGPRLEWKDSITQGLFFTGITYLLTFPLVLFLAQTEHLHAYPVRYWLAAATVLLVAPVLLPFGWTRLLGRSWVRRMVQSPYPTAWDWYFLRRQPVFMLIHLNDGTLVGGYWGPDSYASSYPEHGDLYLSTVHTIDERGRFGAPIPATGGLLIRRDGYRYIEVFTAQGDDHGGQEQ
jgi:hypothetical protein